jgi:hypothetical protein
MSDNGDEVWNGETWDGDDTVSLTWAGWQLADDIADGTIEINGPQELEGTVDELVE